jgi:hypothetical protein
MSQEDANKSYVEHVRDEFRREENRYKEKIETLSMEYQDLRQLCVKHYNTILDLEAVIFGLKRDLEDEINLKNIQIRINADKTAQIEELNGILRKTRE